MPSAVPSRLSPAGQDWDPKIRIDRRSDARGQAAAISALDEFLGVGWSPKIASPARQFVRNEDSRLTLPQGGRVR
jgi:hypothetical protein